MVQRCSVGFQLLRPTPTICRSGVRCAYRNTERIGRHQSRLFRMEQWKTRSSVNHDETDGRPSVGAVLLSSSLVTHIIAHPLVAQAATENVPEGTFDLILKTTEALGPLGGVFFVSAVVMCECIPLFPTTPLSLASGILFGAQKGAIFVLGGTTLASVIAFTVARGFGRPLAEKIISAEMSQDEMEEGGLVQQKLKNIQSAIERGTFWQQAGAVLALRLTPVVPFSASNYVLGLSPLPIGPYLTGTIVGMSFWSVVYASLGGASRALLSKGVDPDVLLGELLEATGNVTSKAAIAGVLGAGIVGAVFFGKSRLTRHHDATHSPNSFGEGDDRMNGEENPSLNALNAAEK